MNLICLVKGHDWAFGYNHGIPRGASWEQLERAKKSGKLYEVHVCSRCQTQSRMLEGKRVVLKKEEYEQP